MAASLRPGPRRKTMSRCYPEIDRCVHVFEIDRYSLHKGSGAGRYIRSASFAVGGHDWCVCVSETGPAETSRKKSKTTSPSSSSS
ncbi:hypothetical protein PR202_ga18891 [Eleusine coracana subsp. coracana]|uniref:MATH domain-containing protein n=1 Tax=Eleusine coracana subsp. coracana TaxID=191504 RepID=A0AAV5CT74_ELECO|nr:hypothetical protein PR202_ga18891 [Eleusine coracana subsp. coracana]